MKTNKNNKLVPYNKSNLSIWDTFDNLFSLDRLFWPTLNIVNVWKVEDVTEDDKNYNLSVKLPGFKKDEVKVTVKDNTLKVVAKNKDSYYGRSFYYSNWDLNNVSPKLENGVLTVSVPKTVTLNPEEKVINVE